MPYKINEKEFEAVLKLPGDKRYEHFVKRVADWQELWSLKAEEGVVWLATAEGQKCIPLWPHPDYATALAKNGWADCRPVLIPLDDFLAQWVEGMTEDAVHAAVFPDLDGRGVVVAPERLRADLELERMQYE